MALRSGFTAVSPHFAVLLLPSGQPFSAGLSLLLPRQGVQRNSAVVADKPLFFAYSSEAVYFSSRRNVCCGDRRKLQTIFDRRFVRSGR